MEWNDLVKEYGIVKNGDSIVVYKKAKIGQVKQGLQDKYGKELNFNNDSACLFSDKGYLLVSGHLKSSK